MRRFVSERRREGRVGGEGGERQREGGAGTVLYGNNGSPGTVW